MKNCTVTDTFVAVLLDSAEMPDPRSAEAMVRRLLEDTHLRRWSGMHIEIFPAHASALLLARPENTLRISIAGYALPYLQEYFTE